MIKRLILLLLFSQSLLSAQEESIKEKRRKGTFELSVGGVGLVYQDVSQSANRYQGLGGFLGGGYNWVLPRQNFISTKLNVNIGSIESTTNDLSSITSLKPRLDLSYKHTFKFSPTFLWSLGAITHWQLLIHTNSNLQNNGRYIIFDNPFMIHGGIEKKLRKRPLRFSLGISLLGIVNKMNGFAFSIQQDILEEGRFSYESDPSLFYGESDVRFIGTGYVQIISELEFQFSKKWSTSYRWDFFYYDYSKDFGYPAVLADHSLLLNWNF